MTKPTTGIVGIAAIGLTCASLSMGGCAKWRERRAARLEASRTAREAREAAKPKPAAPAPNEGEQALARARILKEQGLTDVALQEFERAIAVNPRLVPAYMGVGEIRRERGDLAQAEAAYAQAAAIEPTNFDAQYNRGLVQQLLNRLTDSIKSYLRALQIRPDDFDANLNIATAYMQLSEPAAGLPYAQRAVRLKSDSGPARVNLGAILAAMGDHRAAVVEFQQAAELMELSPELLLNLADSLGRIGRYAEMQNTLEQLVTTNPSAVAYERLASSLFRQQKYDESLATFRKSLEQDPDYYPSLNGVGVCLLNKFLTSEQKDLESRDEALKMLRRSLQIEGRQPAVLDLVTRYG
ncbi:MAG: tetratricopeptide repeat protein [Phycisphaerales bacterium]